MSNHIRGHFACRQPLAKGFWFEVMNINHLASGKKVVGVVECTTEGMTSKQATNLRGSNLIKNGDVRSKWIMEFLTTMQKDCWLCS